MSESEIGEPIRFQATVEKVQTMTDGAVRVYLDLPETALLEMARLVECKIRGLVLDIVATSEKAPAEKERNYGL